MKRALFDRLCALRTAHVPVALVTDLNTGWQSLVTDDGVSGAFGLTDAQLAAVRLALTRDRSGIIDLDEDDDGDDAGLEGAARLFVTTHVPQARLLLVGAVHIAQALVPMATLAGYQVSVIDPRRTFAAETRFPDTTLIGDWPDVALPALAVDARTAVVTLSHDPKLDDPALLVALRSPAFYVGALGSRRTHAKRLDRLRAEGLSEGQLARIHAPVGLAIDALTPAEIAVSIIAQITAVRRRTG